MNRRIRKLTAYIVLAIIAPCIAYVVYQFLDMMHSGNIASNIDWQLWHVYAKLDDPLIRALSLAVMLLLWYLLFSAANPYRSGTRKLVKITDKISIPPAAGNGQYGTARFLSYKEFTQLPYIFKYCPARKEEKPRRAGVVLGRKRSIFGEELVVVDDDRNVILLAPTRSGKDRRILLISIWYTILAGENATIFDPKGEAYAYTSNYARARGYQVLALDFRNPDCGNHYNFLQPILEALAQKDTAKAIDATWDLVALLVGEQKGEAIWHNGECASIAATILIVAIDAPEKYRNMPNVYYFLAMMVETDDYGEMFFSKYLAKKPDNHPAKSVFAMARVAPDKTRGSFFSSALGTLRHFTNPKIAEMTSKTDLSFDDIANKKTVIYLIVPDEKKDIYPLAVLYICQLYQQLIASAILHGNRTPIDWWIFANEFGNYPYIPDFDSYITVGAGRGIRFVLALQDFQQLEEKYKKTAETIKNNCLTWILLKSMSNQTNKEISAKLDNYTVETDGSSSNSGASGGNSSVGRSTNLTGRPLLMPGEIGMLDEPYNLVFNIGEQPVVLYAPDISKYTANKELGLGSRSHNQRVMENMINNRPHRRVGDIPLWGIWNNYIEYGDIEEPAVYSEPPLPAENADVNSPQFF